MQQMLLFQVLLQDFQINQMAVDHYLGNPLLKKANTTQEFTEEQVLEFSRCIDDPIYFAKNYINIVTLDYGLKQFEPYSFQEEMLDKFHNNRFNNCKLPRQSLHDLFFPW